jgi:CDP-diacylglycerol--glycerol-3-phosphate 3-phosphatidyltransferase
VILLISREIAITGLRALASSEGLIIGASKSAKWKTATQMVAIPFLMAHEGLLGIPLFQIGTWLIYISLLISLWSAKDYVVDFFAAIREKRRKKREAKRAAKKVKKTSRLRAKKA